MIFDAYRPARAVQEFYGWKDLPDSPLIKERFYPFITKEEIFAEGFIAMENSSHSRGSTIDLTIVNNKTNSPLEMGTEFDYFGSQSNMDSTEISEKAIKNKKLLLNIMTKHGFKNLPSEWWH